MPQKILVVDDDQYLRDIYQENLVDEGFEVDIAINGEEGLKKLQQGGYALCLLDMMLPKVDGIGVLNSIREHPPQIPNGPIIVLSNLSHDTLIDDALKKGAASYIVKADMTPDQIVAEVRKQINAHPL
jgi:DNA-binding response OmpR family regulator